MFRKKSTARSTIDSLVGASTRLEGNLAFQGGLRIDGQVRGDVIANGEGPSLVVIGEQARVEGAVVASHLIVNGILEGSASVAGMIELQSKARVSGELCYQSIEIHRGAVVEAALAHFDGEVPRPGLKLASSKNAAAPPLLQRAVGSD